MASEVGEVPDRTGSSSRPTQSLRTQQQGFRPAVNALGAGWAAHTGDRLPDRPNLPELTAPRPLPMTLLHSKAIRIHALGLCAVIGGAGLSESSGSMLPLAMGSALALMTTVGLVREIRRRHRARRQDADKRR